MIQLKTPLPDKPASLESIRQLCGNDTAYAALEELNKFDIALYEYAQRISKYRCEEGKAGE